MKFIDENNYTVNLHINQHSNDIKHVLIIPKYKDDYVLTAHKKRGLEFPGGKIEADESMENAARRELFEETGSKVRDMQYIGYYQVESEPSIVKAVYFADVLSVGGRVDYLETNGPRIVHRLETLEENQMSPLLLDACVQYLYEMSLSHEFFKF